jgi:uroporphyrinogen-III synthase
MANVPNATALREGKIVGCIGPVAAEAARAAGLAPDVVADEYTSEGLLRALELVPAG